MQVKKVILLLFLLIPMLDIFYSCCHCDVETEHVSYSHQTLQLKNLDNSGEKAIETESLQINKNAYGIRLYLSREQNATTFTKQVNSIFFHSAYAFHCGCPPECIYSASDSIISINIFTVRKFDDQHPENSNITNYFRPDMENYVANMRYSYESEKPNAFSIEGSIGKLIIDLLLMTAPTSDDLQQFKIQIVLSDGRILEELTSEIELI